MKRLVAVLFAALIIGVTPAFAINIGEITADPMAVRGRGADTGVELQISENGTSNSTAENVNITSDTASTENTTNDDPAPAGDQAIYADAQVPDLNGTIIPENITVPQKDTTGIVMQTTDYSCGPAALATVLQNMGFNVTEHELKVLAGTDVSGTTMYGLAQAARSKGLNASGMRLSIGELRPNMIVHVIKDGTPHYSVVREVTNESVKLADPSLGNIEMTREKFSEIYTGNALVITDPNMGVLDVSVNETSNQTNNIDASAQLQNSQTLTTDAMQNIQGRLIWKPAVIIGFIVKVLVKAIKIGKAAWKSGIRRGGALSRRIERAILNRVPFAGHRRVRNAAIEAAYAIGGYIIATHMGRYRFCWTTAIALGSLGAARGATS